ncbi:MAG: hypothetical protein K2X34_09265, partial [Hyphomonadaceae bacterium]|nr:hypothetical protein [Hyphomonadaceae bacterium]
MPTYTATTGADTLVGSSGDDVFAVGDDSLQSGDSFDGAGGVDELRLDPLGLGLWDFRNATLSSFEALRFNAAGSGTLAATFAASQFGAGLSNSLAVAGNALSTDQIHILMSAGQSFSAASWTFSDWSTGDSVHITGASGAEQIAGSSQNDFILAGEGNDVVTGGQGADTLTGEGGPA